MTRALQIQHILDRAGFGGAELQPLAGDASFRRYIRVRRGEAKAMLMDAPPEKEDVRPYLAIARYLGEQGYSVPHILAADETAGLVLLEDLGDDTFTRLLKQDTTKELLLYESAIDVLAQWHDAARGFSNPKTLPLPIYDEALYMRELELFTDWFVPQVAGKSCLASLKAAYIDIWKRVLASAPVSTDYFVHRDYHADNLMWLPQRMHTQRVGLLDFQDGVYGDAAYDVVSLLEDARRDVPAELVDAMIARYLAATGKNSQSFIEAYSVIGAQRNCKIIGIFSRLAARDNKHHYLSYLPRVWRHLERDLSHPALGDLKQWMDETILHEWRGSISLRYTAEDLVLTA